MARHYGKMIAEARVARGLTQAELGERIGVSQPTVSEIEGRESVTTDTLERCAAALGVTFRVGE